MAHDSSGHIFTAQVVVRPGETTRAVLGQIAVPDRDALNIDTTDTFEE